MKNNDTPPKYEISSKAKITTNLIAHDAVLAADAKNVYVLKEDTNEVILTLSYDKITKAYAQLGELYIQYGFGKMIKARFVVIDAGNVATSAVSTVASGAYHAAQAEEVQDEIGKWLEHFSKHRIEAKQTLSPKKFMILVIIATIILILYRLTKAGH